MDDIWQDDEDILFDYATMVKPYLEAFSIEEIRAAYTDPTCDSLGELRIVHQTVDYSPYRYVIFVNPDNQAFTFLDGTFLNSKLAYCDLSLELRENLEWVTVPVYRNHDGEVEYVNHEELYKSTWGEGEFTQVRISASTDFYEKRGLWPYFVVNQEGSEQSIPFRLFAEIIFQGKKGYVFFDLDWESVDMEADYGLFLEGQQGEALIMFEDSKDWGKSSMDWNHNGSIHFLPYPGETLPTYLQWLASDDEVDASKSFVPLTPLMKTIETCQDALDLYKPYNVPVIQLPVYALRFKGQPVPSNDSNTLTIVTDGGGSFYSYYVQS
jgi:hypothetical protein